jgi:hypothetical protein
MATAAVAGSGCGHRAAPPVLLSAFQGASSGDGLCSRPPHFSSTLP